MSNCPKCGYPIAPDETVCANCGELAENKTEETISPDNIESTEVEENESALENPSEEVAEITETEDKVEESEESDSIKEQSLEDNADLSNNEPEQVEESSSEEALEQTADQTVEEEPSQEIPDASAMMPQDVPVAGLSTEIQQAMPDVSAMIPQEVPTVGLATEMPQAMPDASAMIPQEVPTVGLATEMPQAMPDVSVMMPQEVPVAGMTMGMPQVMPDASAMIPQEVPVAQPQMQPSPLPGLDMALPQMPSIDMSAVETPVAPLEEKPKKDPAKREKIINRIFFILILLVSLVALGLLSYFMVKLFSNENIAVGKKVSETAKEYHYEGFNLYIEDKDKDGKNIHAEIYENEFYVGTDSWTALMTLQTGTYNNLVSNKSQLVDYFKDMGYEATNPEEKEISGTAFVKMEVIMGSKNILVAYAKANGTKLFGIVLENETGEYTDDDIKVIGTILSTSKYVGPKYSLPEGFKLNQFKDTFMVAE